MRLRLLAASVCVVALALIPCARALSDRTEPTLFRPGDGRKGVAVQIPRGKALLYHVLQRVADYTGESTYYAGDTPPDTTITIESPVRALDFKTAEGLLRHAGYELTQQLYRGRKVYWVERPLTPPRKKGSLTRRRPGEPPRAESGDTAEIAGVSLLERRQGSGSRFVITYEANSRQEAEDVLILLEAFQSKQVGQGR